jgi:hypothetical protein
VPISTAKNGSDHLRGGKMKTITLRTMAAFGVALLGGIALVIVLAVGLNVLTWLD